MATINIKSMYTPVRCDRWLTSVMLAAAAALCAPATAEADEVSDTVAVLSGYDADNPATFEALGRLAVLAEQASEGTRAQELKFMVLIASVDLLIIAEITSDTSLRARIANQHRVPIPKLHPLLMQELKHLQTGIFADTVKDARLALQVIQPGPDRASLLSDSTGPRRDLLFIGEVLARLGQPETASASLAQMSADPCGQDVAGQQACPEPLSMFGIRGRRAMKTLSEAGKSGRRLRAVSEADPLVRALSSNLEDHLAQLNASRLQPAPLVRQDVPRVAASSQAQHLAPRLLLFVEPGKVHLSYSPLVSIGNEGHLLLSAPGAPVYPSTEGIPIPDSYPGFLRSIPSLVEALRAHPAIEGETGAKGLAIAALPGTPAHLLGRVALSARRAGFARPALLGSGNDGSMRVLAVEFVTYMGREKLGRSDLDVLVRLGGYTVKRRGPSKSIPRIRTADGFRFDVRALVETARPERSRATAIRFMPNVDSHTLLSTAFAVAPGESRLRLILP